ELHAVKEEYLLSVSASYYEVLRAKKALDIAKANVERLTKHRDAASIRLKVGEVTKTALLRAEAELSGAQSEEIKAKNALELAKAVLARIAGIERDYALKDSRQPSVDNLLSPEPDLVTASCQPEPMNCFKTIALSERVELKGLELQKKIGQEQVKYTQGSHWPTLSIEGVYSRKDEDPAVSTLNKESAYGGLKISIPIFEGGLRDAEVKEAEAKQRQAELLYEDKKKSIDIEVESAYLDLITQKGIMEKFGAQLTFAKDNYKAVSKQFEFGLASSIDVMDANTLLVTAERQLTDSRYNYKLSDLRLKRAAGILLKTAESKIK
ncbi:MAG: TolC family protein, partial [Thermodesulfovibrionales bacterium]|nr:TolC family protein [Thermodesulfovibrionales bacterium]